MAMKHEMGPRSEDSDSEYNPNTPKKKKQKKKPKSGIDETNPTSAVKPATSEPIEATAVVDSADNKQWSKEDIEALVTATIKKHVDAMQLDEEDSIIIGLKTHLARNHYDLDWFDNNESDRDDLVSKWVNSQIMEAKSQLSRALFVTSMNVNKLKAYRAFRRNFL